MNYRTCTAAEYADSALFAYAMCIWLGCPMAPTHGLSALDIFSDAALTIIAMEA